MAPPDLRDVRELLRYRINMVQARTALVNYTHSLLDKYDVTPDVSKMHSKKAIRLLSQIRLKKPNDDMILQNCVKRIAHATEEISDIEAEIDRQAAVNEDAKLLMSMTGIETFVAMLLVSEIGDITRFKTADRLVSWTGMCPRVYQSDNVTHYGRMKKASNRRVNSHVLRASAPVDVMCWQCVWFSPVAGWPAGFLNIRPRLGAEPVLSRTGSLDGAQPVLVAPYTGAVIAPPGHVGKAVKNPGRSDVSAAAAARRAVAPDVTSATRRCALSSAFSA